MPLRASRSDGAIRLVVAAKSPSRLPAACARPVGSPACPFPTSREFGLDDRTLVCFSRTVKKLGAD
jgi:hypothetical protein